MVIVSEEDYLAHYGIVRRSGRYPWGSGGPEKPSTNPNKRNKEFLDYVDSLLKQGLKETEIAQGMGTSTTELRAAKSMALAQTKQANIAQALALKDKGMSNVAAAAKMGIPESTYRTLIAPGAKEKAENITAVANMIKQDVDQYKYIDIGTGVENHIGVSKDKLKVAVAMLKEQGYQVHPVDIRQVGTGLDTRMKVLVPPGVTQRDVFQNKFEIRQLSAVSNDGGRTFTRFQTPIAINPKRVKVNYDEDGGSQADGVIYVRRGVDDLSLGKNSYAQVRVQIGPGHYLKGMAVYKDDLPDGVDLVFNTNKSKKDPDIKSDLDAMKPLKDDPQLPFGSIVDQITNSKGKVTSAMNLVNEEGDWGKWNRNVSAQALSKQSPSLAKKQLDMTYSARKAEFDEIMALTNPVVRKRLLESFADGTDASAVHLKAAALERQNWQVILPINSMKPTEIYAPNFHDGERVALIRYPHGGTFEIPELTVNNRVREARQVLGTKPRDAVGIHHSVAQRLSGADFDGDTVLVIPTDKNRIRTSPPLEGLKDFDPIRLYKNPPGVEFKGNKQIMMGDVSNLITDMTIRGASHDEIARAVRHSMVVIDSEKHNLNHKLSYERNGIADLKRKYQPNERGDARGGASTLISRAGSPEYVPDRKPRPMSEGGPIDPTTGAKVYVPTGRMRRGKDGELEPKLLKSKKLAETDDAKSLVSEGVGTRIEHIYADHSNRLKGLANEARLAQLDVPKMSWSRQAQKVYASELASLQSKLDLAQRNAPLERQAQIIANANIAARRAANPNMEKSTLKKVRYQAQEDARARMGSGKQKIIITDEEWNAIQNGAVSPSMLDKILDNADLDRVRELATPRTRKTMTSANTARAVRLLEAGYTRAEVASKLGVSISTLDAATMGDDVDDDE